MTPNEFGERIKQGDQDAFTLFYAENKDWVYRRAFRRLENHEDADEAVNYVFCAVWRKREMWNPEQSAFTTWVTLICISYVAHARTIRDRAIKKYVGDLESENEDGELPQHRDPNAHDPLDDVSNADMLMRVEGVLIAMDNPLQRVCWMLYYFESYNMAEIARIVDSTKAIVKNRIQQTTRHLRNILTD